MNWGSGSEFWAMGGYAWYVWGSYGVTALFMVIEVIGVRRRQRKALQQLVRNARLSAAEVKYDEGAK